MFLNMTDPFIGPLSEQGKIITTIRLDGLTLRTKCYKRKTARQLSITVFVFLPSCCFLRVCLSVFTSACFSGVVPQIHRMCMLIYTHASLHLALAQALALLRFYEVRP